MTTINALAKLHFENIPANINTIKDLDEYYKQFKKEYRDKLKEEKAVKADKPKRKKGVDKDGNVKEKRPPSKYNVFVKEMYSQIKENNPEMDKTQIFAEIAKLWQEQKNNGDDNKKPEEKPEEKAEESEKDEDVTVEAPKKKPARKAIKKKEAKESSDNDE